MSHSTFTTTLTKFFILPVAMILLLAGFILPAEAGSGQIAAGSLTAQTSMTTPVDADQALKLFHEDASESLAGDLTGTLAESNYWSVRPDGSFQVHGVWTCSPCELDGRTGTFTAEVELVGDGNGYAGMLGITGADGELAGLQGQGLIQSIQSHKTYRISYKFTEIER